MSSLYLSSSIFRRLSEETSKPGQGRNHHFDFTQAPEAADTIADDNVADSPIRHSETRQSDNEDETYVCDLEYKGQYWEWSDVQDEDGPAVAFNKSLKDNGSLNKEREYHRRMNDKSFEVIHEQPAERIATPQSRPAEDDMQTVMLAAKAATLAIQEERVKVVQDKKMYGCEITALEKEVTTLQEWIAQFEHSERVLMEELKQKQVLLAMKGKLEREKKYNLERIRGLLKKREEQKSDTKATMLKTGIDGEAEKLAQLTRTLVGTGGGKRGAEKRAQVTMASQRLRRLL